MDGVDAPGAMLLVVPGNLRALDPAPAMFDAMLTGWERQQQSSLLAKKTISDRVSLVCRFALFNSSYPCQWTAEDVEAYFSAHLTILRARELDADKAETDPPGSSTSASPRYDG
ncbi:hypothetical protein ACFTWS_34510 [Streptomyces sp. NPDC057027]|uniref:hypothetical protein n=1 Tax=Streptomyces sp. NPDC057027 TaxID=3346004 RepID=UPI00364423D5